MSTLYFLLQMIAWILGVFLVVSSLLFFKKLRWPAAVSFIFKIYISALAPVLVILGVLITIVGLITENAILTMIGFYDIGIYSRHLLSVTREPPGWATFLKELKGSPVPSAYQLEDRYFISSRKDLSLPGTPKAQVQKNISYSGLPGTKRK
ncbi:MAG: hypothetical protein KDC80_29565, partial [Saprospiraceae bacterium]|nr:hypothetical protein [Saprospiraceae bacterium]